jgi:ribosomal protein L7Ae-like RNA K-turn-binding protein
VAALIERRCLDLLGLARRAGQVVAGFEKVDAALRSGRTGVLIEAADGAQDGRAKLRGLARGVPVVSCLDSAALASALGRSGPVVHAVIAPGRLAQRFLREADRLRGLFQTTG